MLTTRERQFLAATAGLDPPRPESTPILVHASCDYLRPLMQQAVARRPHLRPTSDPAEAALQWTDYEDIDWERVLRGELAASAFCVRKGLCRKAQLSVFVRRFTAKHPGSVLASSVPATWIVETWEAFEDDMTLNLTGDVASFSVQLPLAQRLDSCLWELKEALDARAGPFILKPSMFNKGAEVRVVRSFEDVRSSIHQWTDIREWVVQEYVRRPLLIRRRKFHVRAYVLAVGALTVYLSGHALALTGMEDYDDADVDNDWAHVTNTARQAAHPAFREEECVLLLREEFAPALARRIEDGMAAVLHDLFAAYRGEFSVFNPLPRCFELYGVDFLVDQDERVWLLEVNPGPDLKQSGSRLQGAIAAVVEDIARVAVDPVVAGAPLDEPGLEDGTAFRRVYCEDWGLRGGPTMSFN